MSEIRSNYALPSITPAEQAGDRIIHRLQEAGCLAYRVGGSVRDRLIGRIPREVDVATDAPPSRVRELFTSTYAVGEQFGVIIVHGDDGVDVEVATFREEHGYADGRHPAHVRYSTPGKDARRRDFTVNALFYDPLRHEIRDFVNGLEDLRRGVIRAIGDPFERFSEDRLRLLRAVRFAAGLGFELEKDTHAAIARLAHTVGTVSAERAAEEFNKMLTGPAPAGAFDLLRRLGLLDCWLPELSAQAGVPQPPQFHPEGDVWAHTCLALSRAPCAIPELMWSVLLHDIGKPPTHVYADGRDRFPSHANHGAALTGEILIRLRMSRRFTDTVAHCVRNHMRFMHVRDMRRSTLRRLLGDPTFPLQLELHRVDCAASHGDFTNYWFLLDAVAEMAAEPPVPEPLVRGTDIMALGVREGPEVGTLLRMVQEWQLEGEVSSKEEALIRVLEYMRKTGTT
ncbi:MAG: CCA tRNA nucleotidyltransferase [Candidatus Pacebacteria bacterium]|nr:CCA tRNA nucleotidyltransferase [Candidatus Paceibacterota bacterium]